MTVSICDPHTDAPTDPLVRRFARYAQLADALWDHGWRGCRDDTERGLWIECHADWLNDQLDR